MCPDLCIILIATDNVFHFYLFPICHRLYLEYAPFFSLFFFFLGGGVVQNEGFFIKALIQKMPLTKPVHLGRSEARRVFFRMLFCM